MDGVMGGMTLTHVKRAWWRGAAERRQGRGFGAHERRFRVGCGYGWLGETSMGPGGTAEENKVQVGFMVDVGARCGRDR
ncbi:hypothetical protein BHE74_00008805 [Ensete ventricosum]|nr:hypothetical protein BHE74_00008805 [Ensete ventricosum]